MKELIEMYDDYIALKHRIIVSVFWIEGHWPYSVRPCTNDLEEQVRRATMLEF